jgi:hypothetical protein
MTATAALGTHARELLREAAAWRLLGLLFECPTPAWREDVRALSREVGEEDLRAAARAALREASEGLYHSAFGPGGPAPAREASYRDVIQLGHLLAELESYYEAFAYRPTIPEAADHVAVEAGFVAYLKMKEAYATVAGDEEHAAIAAEASRVFIDDHLSYVAEPLAAALQRCGVSSLALTGQALLQRVGPPRARSSPLAALNDREESGFCCGDDDPGQEPL